MNQSDKSPLSKILRWPTPRAKRWTEEFLERVETDQNILSVIAVGSSVRPNVTSLDLDLVLICDDPSTFHYEPPMEVDLRRYKANLVDQAVGSKHDLMGWCVKFGVLLYDQSHFWTGILNRWSKNLPLPLAETALDRADAIKRRLNELERIGDADAVLEQTVSYLTHIARARLLNHSAYPASRPELPAQLEKIGEFELAVTLRQNLDQDRAHQT